jgi:hypothetical protein
MKAGVIFADVRLLEPSRNLLLDQSISGFDPKQPSPQGKAVRDTTGKLHHSYSFSRPEMRRSRLLLLPTQPWKI